MILPTIEQLDKVISDNSTRESDYHTWGTEVYLQIAPHQKSKLISQIIDLIKMVQFDESNNEETAVVDPNLVKIAELEAKIKVYESVIESAGIKLGIKKK